ncbi:MAG: sporulation transcriptional regulator SpoIIID [Oscillospiraceae bacterium]|nr:sporulation transcriptional regulator SpoIIID [Oscillospiraceae bacterium]
MYGGEYILKPKPVQDIEERAVILGRYILENKATVRANSNTNKFVSYFGVFKSTVHMVVANLKIHFLLFCSYTNISLAVAVLRLRRLFINKYPSSHYSL